MSIHDTQYTVSLTVLIVGRTAAAVLAELEQRLIDDVGLHNDPWEVQVRESLIRPTKK